MFQSQEDFHQKMHRMVSSDQIPRLGDGWMIWAKTQASEWEAMEAQQQHDEEAIQIRLADQPKP